MQKNLFTSYDILFRLRKQTTKTLDKKPNYDDNFNFSTLILLNFIMINIWSP